MDAIFSGSLKQPPLQMAESMNRLKLVFTFIFLLVLSACTNFIELNPILDKQSVYDPIPLTVRYFKNPDLITRLEKREYRMGSPLVFPIGKASSELFEQILATMFTKVVPVLNRDFKPLPGTNKYAGTASIDIKEFFYAVDSMYTGNPYPYSISYSFSIMDSTGNPVVSWPITSSTGPSEACPGKFYCTQKELAEFVMLDAMAKFIVDFHNKPEITRWLSAHGVTEGETK